MNDSHTLNINFCNFLYPQALVHYNNIILIIKLIRLIMLDTPVILQTPIIYV